MARKKRPIPEINAGSMADIAFLLLVFFLVTTTMDTDKGLRVKLPPFPDPNTPPPTSTQNNRNVLEVLVNSRDYLLVEQNIMNIENLTELTKQHLTNEGKRDDLAESSVKAIVSLKNDRGTSYKRYVEVYNELMRAYREVRDEYAGKNIAFTMFNSNIQDNLSRISKEAEEFGIDFPIMKDEGQRLAKALGVERTAEAFVFDPKTQKVLFRGPINDQLGYETQRNSASEWYLKDALDTILEGNQVNMDNVPDSKGCLVAIFNN